MLRITADQLRAAGFSEESIINFVENERPNLKAVGFSDHQINNFYGLQKTTVINPLDDELDDKYDGLLKTRTAENEVNTENVSILEKKAQQGKKSDTSNESIDFTNNIETDPNEEKPQTYVSSTNSSYETDAVRPVVGDSKGKYNSEQYKIAQTEIDRKEAEETGAQIMLSKGKIYHDRLTDQQREEWFRNGGQLTIDGKPVEVVYRKLKKDGERTKFPVLAEEPTTLEYSKTVLNALQLNLGLDLNEINTLNFNMGVVSGIVSDNKSVRNRDDTAGGVFQIRDDEVIGLLNILNDIMVETNPEFKRPSWWNKAYGHKKADALPPDVERALSLIKFTRNEEARDIVVRAAKGDVDALKTMLYEYYDTSIKEDQEKFEKAEAYYGAWNTFDYEYVMPQLAKFGDSDQSWLTRQLERTELGKDFIQWSGGKGYDNAFTTGYKMSVMGLMKEFAKQIDEYGYTPKEAYEAVFMHQSPTFSNELIVMATQLAGDSPAIALGTSLGFVGGAPTGPAAPIIALTGGLTLPEVIRDVYMRAILNGEVDNFSDFMSELISMNTLKTTAKFATTGVVTGGVGRFVRPKAGSTAGLAAETATMVTMLSLMEGQVPTRKDFLHAGVLIFGTHGAITGTNKLYSIYKKYGIHPSSVEKVSKEDPDFLSDLLNTEKEAPQLIIDMNEALTVGLEKKTGVKIVEPPKNNIGTNVKIESGTDSGKITRREETEFGEVILEIERPNGDKIYVPEENTYMAMSKNDTEAVIRNNSIEIKQKIDKDFTEKQKNKVFSSDVVETRKDATFLRKNLDDVEGEVVNYTKNDNVVSSRDTIGTESYFVNKKAFPELAKKIQSTLGEVQKKLKTSDDVLAAYFKKLNTSKVSKVDEVFGIRKNGETGSRYSKMVLRTNKGEFIEVPSQIYSNMKEFNYTEGNITTQASTVFAYNNGLLIAFDELNKKIIGVLKAKRVSPKIDNQANLYYERHIERKDKIFADRNFENYDTGTRKMPDEPDSIFNEPETDYRFNETHKQFFNSAKGLEVYDLVQLVKQLTGKEILLKNVIRANGGEALGVFRSTPRNAARAKNDKQLSVEIKRALQEDPEAFTMTLAHEIGHLIDSLPEVVIKNKDNILSRLSGLKTYMNNWIGAKGDGASPLNPKEIARLKKDAEKQASKEFSKNAKDIEEDFGIKPEDIVGIVNDPNIRQKIDPKFYDAFVSLSEPLKVQIFKSAMRGIIDPYVKPLVDKFTKSGTKHSADIKELADQIFAKKMETELRNRGLVSREEITKELIALSKKWKPYDAEALKRDPEGAKYVKYRESSPELMADFMMALLTRPRWTLLNAPRSTQLFYNHMYTRPEVRIAYEKTQNILNAPKSERYGQMFLDTMDMFSRGNQRLLEAKQNAWREAGRNFDDFMIDFVDHTGWFINRKAGGHKGYTIDGLFQNRWKDEATLQLDKKIKDYLYRPVVIESYSRKVGKVVEKLGSVKGDGVRLLGSALLYRNLANSTQRSKLANPTGMWAMLERDAEGRAYLAKHQDKLRNPKEAYEQLIKEHPILDELATEFFNIRKEYIIPLFRESKAFSKKQLEMIENNLEYINYNVQDAAVKIMQESGGTKTLYAAFTKPAIGTLKDILNPLQSTFEKDVLLIGELKRNVMIHDSVMWLINNKKWLETFGAKNMQEIIPNWKDRIVQKAGRTYGGALEKAPNGMETISFLSGGKYQHFHVNKKAAIAFKRNPVVYHEYLSILSGVNAFLRGIYTQYSPPFWTKNLYKDTKATVTNLPKATYLFGKDTAYVPEVIKAFKPAWKSVFGDGTDLTRMYDREGYWLPISDGYRTQAGRKHLDYMYKNGELTADQYYTENLLRKMTDKQRNTYLDKTLKPLIDKIGKVAIVFDRVNKIAPYNQIKKMEKAGIIPKMSEDELKIKIIQDYGSPPFALHGTLHPITNNLILFSNAFTQGWRRDLSVMKDDPISVLGKHAKYNFAPKALEFAAKIGFFGSTYALWYEGVKEYDQLNYHNIVLGVTSTGRTYYLKLPMDETARFFTGLLYKTGEYTIGKSDFADIVSVFTESLPDETPSLDIITNAFKVFLGSQNPRDSYTGQTIIDQDVWDSKNLRRKAKEFFKYQWNNTIPASIYRFKSDDLDELASELEEILGIPIVGSQIKNFLTVGNDPNLVLARKDLDTQRMVEAGKRVTYKDAIFKLVDPMNSDPFTKDELMVLAENRDNIGNNPVVKRYLSRALGGSDIFEFFQTAGSNKEAVIIANRMLNEDQSVNGDNPQNVIDLLFGKEKETENVLQNNIE